MKWKASKNVKWVLNEVFGGGNENDNHNDNENNPQRTRRDTDGCPQADFVGEQVLITDERLMINDGVHTENTEGNGCPQADCFWETAIAINDQQLKEKKCISTDDTDGGPQADCFEERELWRIDRELKEIGPQADEVGEQQLSKIRQQLKEKFVCEPWLLWEPNEKEGKKLLEEIMKGGNFGQYDTRDAALKKGGMVKHGVWKLKRVMRLVSSYPEEALWEPVFRVYHLVWRGING